MVESRWLRWFGPGLVALGAVGLVASTTIGAGTRAWAPLPCSGTPADRSAAARDTSPVVPADLAPVPWFRLDPVAGDDGSLRGQRLVLGRVADPIARSLELTAESFAAGPFGRIVLVGSDDGSTSRLTAIDVAQGCSWVLDSERDIVRRATIDPSGTLVYEMRVDRATRADLGIWRRHVDAGEPAVRVLGPIGSDARFGRTFSTEFTWDMAGRRLAVQSCGEVACRTRVIAPDSASTELLDAPDLGLLVGLDGDRVVTYASCRGLPCPIVSTDIRTGQRRLLAGSAGFATLVRTPGGTRLVHETRSTPASPLRSVDLDGRTSVDLAPIPTDDRLATNPFTGGSAIRLPAGWVVLAPEGRLPIDLTDHRSQLRHIPDGATVPLDEAIR